MKKLGNNYKEYYITVLCSLLNPYILLAIYFTSKGFKIWGIWPGYRIDYSLLALLKILGIPTFAFISSWVALRRWTKMNYWKTYIVSFVISWILIDTIFNIYWKFIRHS